MSIIILCIYNMYYIPVYARMLDVRNGLQVAIDKSVLCLLRLALIHNIGEVYRSDTVHLLLTVPKRYSSRF